MWKDKFESVRCSVLLEAFSRLNHTHQKHFSRQSDAPGAYCTDACACPPAHCVVTWISISFIGFIMCSCNGVVWR